MHCLLSKKMRFVDICDRRNIEVVPSDLLTQGHFLPSNEAFPQLFGLIIDLPFQFRVNLEQVHVFIPRSYPGDGGGVINPEMVPGQEGEHRGPVIATPALCDPREPVFISSVLTGKELQSSLPCCSLKGKELLLQPHLCICIYSV